MSENNHTPGPWYVKPSFYEDGPATVHSDLLDIALIHSRMEDAELIADSPRLKESNQELLKILGEVLGCLMIMGLTGRARPTRNGLTTWRTRSKNIRWVSK